MLQYLHTHLRQIQLPRSRRAFTVALLLGITTALGSAQTTDIFVDKGSPAASPTGLAGWADAFQDLQPALDVARNQAPSRILVAEGTYIPSTDANGNANTPQDDWTFALPSYTSLYGGFLGWDADPNVLATRSTDWNAPDGSFQKTVLSGDHGNGSHSRHVVIAYSLMADYWIDGFVITGGHATGGGASSDGGGLYVSAPSSQYGQLTLENVWFLSNSADGRGGAMFNLSVPTTRMRFCTFARNYAQNGGAVNHVAGQLEAANCLFALNGSLTAGATYPATISGGALWIDPQTNTWFQNCVFHDNDAQDSGGAVHHEAFTGLIQNNSFEHFYHNCTITQNHLSVDADSQQGAGIHVTPGHPRPQMPGYTGEQNIRILNTILWGNSPGVDIAVFGQLTNPTYHGVDVDVSYSDIGTWADVDTAAPGGLDLTINNISADPQFINLAIRNLHLRGTNTLGLPVSPCIDFGLSGIPGVGDDRLNIDDDPAPAPSEPLPLDFDLEKRDYDLNLGVRTVDLGAFERQG